MTQPLVALEAGRTQERFGNNLMRVAHLKELGRQNTLAEYAMQRKVKAGNLAQAAAGKMLAPRSSEPGQRPGRTPVAPEIPELVAYSPEIAGKIVDLSNEMDDQTLKNWNDNTRVIGSTLAQLQNMPHLERVGVYPALSRLMIERFGVPPERVPEAYDEAYIEGSIAEAEGVSKYLERIQKERQATQPKPLTREAKAGQDLANEFIDQPTHARITGGKKPSPTNLQKEAKSLYPDDPAKQRRYIERARLKPGATVNVNTKNNPVYARYEEARGRIQESSERSNRLEQMMSLIPKVKSGWGADLQLRGKKLAKALGFEVSDADIANAELFKVKSMDFVMERISDTKGAISEREMEAFERASPNLGNTQAGNALIIKVALEGERRARQLDEYQMEISSRNPDMSVFEVDRLVKVKGEELRDKPLFNKREQKLLHEAGLKTPGTGSQNTGEVTPEDIEGARQEMDRRKRLGIWKRPLRDAEDMTLHESTGSF